ncbi:Smr/MutS family protein [Pseudotenacibaculum sp. MALMAid0570]|uniref:Smr/MutS family protein n=1 Tax=Pseudotenacibaculum sp. MALMAid0570 TaxID=3143938 RepID=UPI0032DF2314
MRFEIGAKVAVIDDVLKGIVTSVNGDTIYVKDSEGMIYQFHSDELVMIKEDQRELTKYSDINNPLFKDKKSERKKEKTHFKKQNSNVVFEVDLHINQLVDNVKGMDNYSMLSLQIETAKRKLEYAIANRFSKVIFIHGVGEGVLKSELQYLLKKYPVDFYDASYQKYGLGATEVYIFQNSKS